MSGILGALLGSNGSSTSDASQTTAFLARTSGLDATHTNAYKALINGLVTDGVFAKLDGLYIPATKDSTTATLNLCGTSFTLIPSTSAAPTFTADQGYTGAAIDGSTDPRLDTQFTPGTSSGNYAQNSAHIGIYVRTIGTAGTQRRHGWLDGGATVGGYIAISNGTSAFSNINSAFDTTISAANTSPGHLIGNRSGATANQLYLNGSSAGTSADASVSLTGAVSIWFCSRHFGTGPNQSSDDQVAAFHFGGSLTSTDAGNLNSRLVTFLTAVGAI